MRYIVESNIRKYLHENNKRITKDGMAAVERKLIEFVDKCARQFNGHKKTIDSTLVNMLKF